MSKLRSTAIRLIPLAALVFVVAETAGVYHP